MTSEIGAKVLRSMTADGASFPTSVIASQRVLRILRELQASENVNVVRLMSCEPLLSAKVLRLANSVAFNTGKPVRTLAPAVLKIGTNNVQTLALILVMDQLRRSHKLPECKELSDRLWSHSVLLAAVSYVMSKVRKNKIADEAMLAGIVHNIGKFYTLAHISEPNGIIEIVNSCHVKARSLVFDKLKIPPYLNDACRNADAGIAADDLSQTLIDALSVVSYKDPCGDLSTSKVDFSIDEHADEIFSIVLSLES